MEVWKVPIRSLAIWMAIARSSTLEDDLIANEKNKQMKMTLAERMSSERVNVRIIMWKVVNAWELRSRACSTLLLKKCC